MLFRSDDDLRIGMKTSAITLGRFDVLAVLLCYLIYLSIWAVALYSLVWKATLLMAIVLALAQVIWHYSLIRERTREGCFKAFRLNHWLGLTMFLGIVFGTEWR